MYIEELGIRGGNGLFASHNNSFVLPLLEMQNNIGMHGKLTNIRNG